MEDEVKPEKIAEKTEMRKGKLEMARKVGELITCSCCFEDELLIDDMLQCFDGHLYCKACVKKSAEVNIGLNKYAFPCLDPYCEMEFPMTALQVVLKPSTFSNVIRKLQAEEIKKADIADLESCPHCSFCAIMPDENDKLFKCLNPECLKETCRLCKEPNHIPFRCHEIEHRREVKMRTYIENKMTDALLRTCPKCSNRFVKSSGCNFVSCPCGEKMCYVCREAIDSHAHFENGRCPQYCNDDEMHLHEVKTGAEKARLEFIEKHPDMEKVTLRHEPTNILPLPPVLRKRSRAKPTPLITNGTIAFIHPGKRISEPSLRLSAQQPATQLPAECPHLQPQLPPQRQRPSQLQRFAQPCFLVEPQHVDEALSTRVEIEFDEEMMDPDWHTTSSNLNSTGRSSKYSTSDSDIIEFKDIVRNLSDSNVEFKEITRNHSYSCNEELDGIVRGTGHGTCIRRRSESDFNKITVSNGTGGRYLDLENNGGHDSDFKEIVGCLDSEFGEITRSNSDGGFEEIVARSSNSDCFNFGDRYFGCDYWDGKSDAESGSSYGSVVRTSFDSVDPNAPFEDDESHWSSVKDTSWNSCGSGRNSSGDLSFVSRRDDSPCTSCTSMYDVAEIEEVVEESVSAALD